MQTNQTNEDLIMDWITFVFVVVYACLHGINNFSMKVFKGIHGQRVQQDVLGKVIDIFWVFAIIYLLALDFHIVLRDFVQHGLK